MPPLSIGSELVSSVDAGFRWHPNVAQFWCCFRITSIQSAWLRGEKQVAPFLLRLFRQTGVLTYSRGIPTDVTFPSSN